MRATLFFAILAVPASTFAQVLPGQWEIVTTMSAFEMPGAPPGIAAMMKGRPIRISQCLTPEKAKNGPREMLKADRGCTFTRYAMAGGKFDAAMTCAQKGGTMTSVSNGTFTPTGFTTTGKTVMTGPQAMSMTATTVGRRTGDCR